MSKIWNTLIEIQHLLETRFSETGTEIFEKGMDRFNQRGWINRVWASEKYRRAHIDVVDTRDSKGLWMMHCCVFPHIHNPAPIFGFDVIAGKNLITGCFLDYSPTSDSSHFMIKYFSDTVSKYEWIKTRELPDWALRIFSPYMVAASNVTQEKELNQITSLIQTLITYYLHEVGKTNHTIQNNTEQQNYYAQNQKQNPHTPRVMAKLGLNEEDVKLFIQEYLFPEIES
jgi:hypothetical protein